MKWKKPGDSLNTIELAPNWYESLRLFIGVGAGAATAVIAVLAGLGWWAGALAVGAAAVAWSRVAEAFLNQVVDPLSNWKDGRAARRRKALEVLYPGTPAPFSRVDAFDISVWKSPVADRYRLFSDVRPPYVPRAIDKPLRAAVRSVAAGSSGGAVVLRGDARAGKSRTFWEALASRPSTSTRTLYALRTPDQRNSYTLRPIETLLTANLRLHGPQAILWIDDAHEHLGYGLTLDTLNELLDSFPGLLIAIVILTDKLNAQPAQQNEISAVDRKLVDYLRALSENHDLQGELDEDEQAKALLTYRGLESLVEDPRDIERLPEWFAGVSHLRDRYRNGRQVDVEGVAVAKAAIDWRRAGMPAGMTTGQLREFADVELDELARGKFFTDDTFVSALAWARGEDPASDPRWRGLALVTPVPGSHGGLWRDFDAVTAWAPTLDPPVSKSYWHVLSNHLTPEHGLPVGLAAYEAKVFDVAETALRLAVEHPLHSAAAGDALGVLLAKDGRLDEAVLTFRQALASSSGELRPYIMLNLALALRQTGNPGAEGLEEQAWRELK